MSLGNGHGEMIRGDDRGEIRKRDRWFYIDDSNFHTQWFKRSIMRALNYPSEPRITRDHLYGILQRGKRLDRSKLITPRYRQVKITFILEN